LQVDRPVIEALKIVVVVIVVLAFPHADASLAPVEKVAVIDVLGTVPQHQFRLGVVFEGIKTVDVLAGLAGDDLPVAVTLREGAVFHHRAAVKVGRVLTPIRMGSTPSLLPPTGMFLNEQ